MLQQTTVGTVLNHFERFLLHYPTLKALAQSTEEQICVAWKGLGYYRRARNLLKAAHFIVEKYGGKIPLKYDKLIQIPGIGDYTASALISIGGNKRALSIDANIERVTARLYAIKMEKGRMLQKEIKTKFDAKKIYSDFDQYSPREFNEALMDLGRVFCQATKANCPLCPVKATCMGASDPLSFPLSPHKVKQSFELNLVRYVVRKENQVLVYQKSKRNWLAGQYELPTFIWKSQDPSLQQYPKWGKGKIQPIMALKSAITKYKITNHIVEVSEQQARKMYRQHATLLFKDISSHENLSSTTFKILQRLSKIKNRAENRPDSVPLK